MAANTLTPDCHQVGGVTQNRHDLSYAANLLEFKLEAIREFVYESEGYENCHTRIGSVYLLDDALMLVKGLSEAIGRLPSWIKED